MYEVAVGGQFLFRLRDKDGHASVQARGKTIEEQIVLMLSDGRKGKLTARTVETPGGWMVKYGELRVVTATSLDAAANGTTAEKLATKWAADLNIALGKLKSSTAATPDAQ